MEARIAVPPMRTSRLVARPLSMLLEENAFSVRLMLTSFHPSTEGLFFLQSLLRGMAFCPSPAGDHPFRIAFTYLVHKSVRSRDGDLAELRSTHLREAVRTR